MTVDKTTNPSLYEARKHYWALQQNVIAATDATTSLSPAEGQLIADDGADNVNANEYASLYKSENMNSGVGNSSTLKNIVIIVAVVVIAYMAYKHVIKKKSSPITVPVQ